MKIHRLAAGVVLLGIAAFAATAHLAAQAQQRALYVTAVDKAGNPLPELQPSDVIVREDDQTREVLRVAPATEPMQVAVMVDTSAAAERFIRDYRDALPAFVGALTADAQVSGKHEIALIGLGERPTILADYTTDPARVQKGIDRVFAASGSAVYFLDGVIETSQGIIKRGNPRPVIVAIITEGPDLSDRHFRQVLEPLQTSGAALHIITLGAPRNMEDDRSMVLEMGPKQSGGSFSTILVGTALTGRLKQLANEITHQFRVTYARPNRLIPPEKVTVSSKRPDVTLRGTAVDPTREPSPPRP
jgi:hypothetical protein